MNARTPGPLSEKDALVEVERLAAADLVMKARNVEQLSRETPNRATRQMYAAAFARVRDEMAAAASRMERDRADDDIPEFIAEGSTVDLDESRRRRNA